MCVDNDNNSEAYSIDLKINYKQHKISVHWKHKKREESYLELLKKLASSQQGISAREEQLSAVNLDQIYGGIVFSFLDLKTMKPAYDRTCPHIVFDLYCIIYFAF